MLPAMRFTLHPHRSSRRTPLRAIDVEVARPGPDALTLRYTMTGDIGGIVLPDPAAPARADALWRHTCFEAFIASAHGDGYCEFNFSPARAWAAYAFDGYRSGMRSAEVEAPVIAVTQDVASFRLDTSLQLPSNAGTRLALTAVIEHADGELAYWALAHAPGKPDFHHRAGFVAELPAPETP